MKNIILTGLMGSGKTTVASLLKKFFPNFQLVEIDEEIVKYEGCSINEIFNTKGEKYFRELEKNIIIKILKNNNKIISLGGGSLENDFDFEAAKKNSVMFYLSADVEILYERIKNSNNRPLLNCENPIKKLEQLLKMRENNYKKADYIIDVNKKNAAETANEIARIYNDSTDN